MIPILASLGAEIVALSQAHDTNAFNPDPESYCVKSDFEVVVTEFTKACESYEQPMFRDEIESSLEGIREFNAWLQNWISSILNQFTRRQHPRPHFIPCWSSRRWKSLT